MSDSCTRCGGVLPPACGPHRVCPYCHTPNASPDLAAGQIWLTDESVLAHLRQQLAGVDCTFLHPSVPRKKIASVRQVHAAHLPPSEVVLAVYDGTAFGSAKDGWAATSRRLCFKNQMMAPQMLEWGDIPEHDVFVDGSRLVVGRAELDTLFGRDDRGLWAWADAIATLARSARPATEVRAQRVPAQAEPDARWGGPEVAVPGAAGNGGWGGIESAHAAGAGVAPNALVPEVEQLPQAPYAVDRSPSVVDVHPSGEIVLAAGSGVLELRYASGGQRYLALPSPDSVLDARFSPDGNWLLVGGLDDRANLYDVRTGQHRGACERMQDYCDEVVWLGHTGRFAAASQQGEVWIVDASTMAVTHRVLGPDPDYHQLGGIAATADGSRLFVSVGERLGAFDTESGRVLWRLDDAGYNGWRLTASPRGDVLIGAGYDGVAVFDARTGRPGPRLQFPCARSVTWPEPRTSLLGRLRGDDESPIYSWSPRPRMSPDGSLVAVQDRVGNLAFVDVATGALHPTPRVVGRAWIEDLAWFPDGNHLLLGTSDNTLAVWSVRPLLGVMRSEAIGHLAPGAWDHAPQPPDPLRHR